MRNNVEDDITEETTFLIVLLLDLKNSIDEKGVKACKTFEAHIDSALNIANSLRGECGAGRGSVA